MNPIVAILVCACGIAGLFYLDRDKTVRTSRALWLPIIWIALAGSRSISAWLSARAWYNVDPDSSPLDVVVFLVLLVAGLGVLLVRSKWARILIVKNWPILVYFFFCLVSITWAYHPDVSLKRWIKAIGDLVMVLVILTDRQPMAALSRLTSRLGFLLLPTSVLLIKYFPELGRAYTPDGIQMNTGVTTNKNMLGVILLVIALCTLWRTIAIWRAKDMPDRRRHLLVQGVLLAFCLELFWIAHSATCLACFVLGGGIVIATSLRTFRQKPIRIHALCSAIAIVGIAAFLFGAQEALIHALGRNADLSGRTEIWESVIPAAPNALIGAGFEGFWNSPSVEVFQHNLAAMGWWHPEDLNEAHDGYIEVYLNLGWIGVCLIAAILIAGYRSGIRAFRLNPKVGGLFLAYIVVSFVYSITEAGFRMLDPMWIFLLLAVIGSSGVAAGLFSNKPKSVLTVRNQKAEGTVTKDHPDPEREAVFAGRRGLTAALVARANSPR
jgi:exopolysaccharide production protein ExoQ